MNKLTFYFLIPIIIISGFLTFHSSALAQSIDNGLVADTLPGLIGKLSGYLLNIAGPLATLIGLWAAFLFITAAGDPKKITQGKQALTWAVVGLAVVLLANSITQITQSTIGGGTIEGILDKLIGYARNIGGPVAIVMFLVGSFMYATGQPKNIQTALKIFLWTSAGIAVIMIASSIQVIVKFFIK